MRTARAKVYLTLTPTFSHEEVTIIGCILFVVCQTGLPSGLGWLPGIQQDLTGLLYASQSFSMLMTQLDPDDDAAISRQKLERQLL